MTPTIARIGGSPGRGTAVLRLTLCPPARPDVPGSPRRDLPARRPGCAQPAHRVGGPVRGGIHGRLHGPGRQRHGVRPASSTHRGLLQQTAGLAVVAFGCLALLVAGSRLLLPPGRCAGIRGSSAGGGPGLPCWARPSRSGWSPCIGPVLGSVLTMAASERSAAEGSWLLACYAVGIALPLLACSLFVEQDPERHPLAGSPCRRRHPLVRARARRDRHPGRRRGWPGWRRGCEGDAAASSGRVHYQRLLFLRCAPDRTTPERRSGCSRLRLVAARVRPQRAPPARGLRLRGRPRRPGDARRRGRGPDDRPVARGLPPRQARRRRPAGGVVRSPTRPQRRSRSRTAEQALRRQRHADRRVRSSSPLRHRGPDPGEGRGTKPSGARGRPARWR